MKKTIKKFSRYICYTTNTAIFFVKYVLHGLFRPRLSLKHHNGRTLTLLANGPSLKDVLPRLTTDSEFADTDFIVLNHFANTPEFFSTKPTHYCLSDQRFFHKNHNYDTVSELFSIFEEKVDWDMNIYVPHFVSRCFMRFSKLTNPHIHVIPVNTGVFSGFPQMRNWLYSHGVTAPLFYTVANLAIFVGINQGYSKIRLYGVDHTWFNGLCVNGNNQVCMKEEHFYEMEPTLKPIINDSKDKPWKMSEYIFTRSRIFKSHDLLAEYAKSIGTEILNCTECSLIDSYPRFSKNK